MAFWEKIYSSHSINSAVIHDKEDLSKIYEVVYLLPQDLPGAERLNRALLDQTLEKYGTLLKQLSQGRKAASAEEKHIAAMFSGAGAGKRMARAAQNVRAQTGMKERFREGIIRSGAYMPEIQRIFRSYGLPPELAYLPHVESSFNNRAHSKFGAVGMWQFTRATGKQYLRIDEAIDERRDPLVAAHAAAKYLKNSYTLLGNWPLALTAYNYGTAGMLRAREAKGSYENIFSEYSEGYFKFASRNFYSEFIAALHIARKLEHDPAVRRDPPLQIYSYTLPGYLPVADVRRHFNISSDTVRLLNPALLPAVHRGEKYIPKGSTLHLPSRKNISGLTTSIPLGYYKTSQKKSPFHRVQPGDTAGTIAQRHRIPLKELIVANNLDRQATIYVGQKLRIPSRGGRNTSPDITPQLTATTKKKVSSRTPIAPANSAAKPVLLTLTGGKKTLPREDTIGQKPAEVAPGRPITIKKNETGQVHGNVTTVEPEESLGLYAEWLQMPEQKLRQLNSLEMLETIHPGQAVILDFSQVSVDTFHEKRTDFLKETEDDFFAAYAIVGQKKYIVHHGDTLWDICTNKFDIPLWLLKKYNTNLNFTRLHASQELAIPILKAI